MVVDQVKTARPSRFIRIAIWLLLLALIPVMLLSLYIVIQSARHPERLPAFLGYKALILLPEAPGADRALGIIRTVDPARLQTAEQVAYRENSVYFVEPVSQVERIQGRLNVQTESAPGSQAAQTTVSGDQIEGVLISRIPRIGSWALQLQTPSGMLLVLLLPVLLFLLLDSLPRLRPASPPLVRKTAGPSKPAMNPNPPAMPDGFEHGSIRPNQI